MPRKTKKPGWVYGTWITPDTTRMEMELPAAEFMALLYSMSSEDERAKMIQMMATKAAKSDCRLATEAT